ncbi:cytochrome c-type biogenesis protein [Methylocella tundrae]|uniref:Cytochrome c-type biogenesis protein n=1 Tax=Methylocella tundrae TaxID=227605 RepID=A0A4U8YVF5_METTU|nr:cytochrome c-type biogenesis protein [Methylocella tundrae]WPP05390.1 cytochrome c-type biogenesis protein [Methylocella tundrae]VFU07768.1 Cytochrome c-type biogenesis protein CcmH [Methylocella tundrae]
MGFCLRKWALIAIVALSPLTARAVEPDEILPDAKLEARARSLSTQLRCMVCQNESIDDSGAPLAKDLRLLVRERLKAGDSDDQIRAYLVRRYGDFILLKPPFKVETALLWGGPFAILLVGGAAIFLNASRRRAAPPAAHPLSDSEGQRLKSLLDREAS